VLQAILRLIFLAAIIQMVARALRRPRPAPPGGISQGSGPDRVKTPRSEPLSPYDIVDGEYEEIPVSRDSEP